MTNSLAEVNRGVTSIDTSPVVGSRTMVAHPADKRGCLCSIWYTFRSRSLALSYWINPVPSCSTLPPNQFVTHKVNSLCSRRGICGFEFSCAHPLLCVQLALDHGSTIHADDLTRHPVAFRSRQEHHRPDNFLRSTNSIERAHA